MPAFFAQPLILIISIATALTLIIERAVNKQPLFAKVPQNMLILGLIAAVFMSHMAHLFFWGARHAVAVFYVNIVLFFIILNALNTPRKFRIALWFIILMIALMAIQGIIQAKTGYGWAGQQMIHETNTGKGRINWIGIFNDPNDLALTLVIAVGILLAFIFGKSNIFIKILIVPIIGILFYGVYLTNSRGGFLALLTTVFFYFVKRSRKIILGITLGVTFMAAILIIAPSRMSTLSTEDESAANRIDMWYEGVNMIKASPLFGRGFGMFTEEQPLTTHNSYMLVAAELGLLGLFFFIGLIYTSFKELTLAQKIDPGLKSYALGLQAALAGFCVAAFFLSRSYVILPYLLFAFSGALFYLAQQRNKELQFSFSKNDFRNTGILSVGVLLLIYVAIKIGLK